MKTAMQELIEWIYETRTTHSHGDVINMAENLLDREREQMRHSFLCGDDAVYHFNREEDFKSFDEYYKETYNHDRL